MICVFCKGFESPFPACFFMDHGALEPNAGAMDITFCSFASTMPLDCLIQLA